MNDCQWWMCEFGPSGVIWLCLKYFWLSWLDEGRPCHWHLVGRGEGCCWNPEVHRAAPHNKELSGPTKNHLGPNIWSANIGKPLAWRRDRKPWSVVWFRHQEPSNNRQNCLTSVSVSFFFVAIQIMLHYPPIFESHSTDHCELIDVKMLYKLKICTTCMIMLLSHFICVRLCATP